MNWLWRLLRREARPICYTTLMIPEPSIGGAMSSVLDLGGTAYTGLAVDGDEADRLAMLADWYAVDSDLNAAIKDWEVAR